MKPLSPELPEFGRVARYEKTLKERLAAGEVMRHQLNGYPSASMRKLRDDVVMQGFTGSHRLSFDASTSERIETHWTLFCEANDKLHGQVRRSASR